MTTKTPTEEAVERVTRYVAMRDAKPLRNQDDTIHGIHTGTEWAGEINLSDVRHLLSELSRLQAERDRAVEELAAAAKSMDNARRAIESGQVVDKDVHGTLCRARDRARAALTIQEETKP